ncbi:hypothetical protein JOE21_001670 [Desmospora profundinema]|uniref:Uncharacterized protein n=1 Tax=Desmospora profundinema TaxID=1571184 RepID=A0ABU1ILL1_9BACL|nr:hypothetical protein [Desmospora profundinema]
MAFGAPLRFLQRNELYRPGISPYGFTRQALVLQLCL